MYKLIKEEGGLDIVSIDLNKKTNWKAYMLIATIKDDQHGNLITRMIQHEAKRNNFDKKLEVNVQEDGCWIVIGTTDLVIELMTPEIRESSILERYWVLKDSTK